MRIKAMRIWQTKNVFRGSRLDAGTLHQQTIELGKGETTIINHFFVTSIEVLARSKRTSITAYERANG